MSDLWYCTTCGFGPHNPAVHLACIMCGTIYTSSFSIELSDVHTTDLLNFSNVRPRRHKNPFQNDLSDDSFEDSSVSASQSNAIEWDCRPLS